MDFGDDDFVSKDDIDPAAEFLAREQSALGELEAEILPTVSSTAAPVATAVVNDESLLGGVVNGIDGPAADLAIPNAISGLESSTGSFEMIQTFGGENNDVIGISGPPPSRVEPEKIRKWREEQKKRLEEKDREEERKREELRLQAKQELEDWLRQTEESIAKTKAASRQAEKQVSMENGGPMEPGTEWERIAKLCDFNPKTSNKSGGKDVSRMRSIYLHLKQHPISMQKRG